MVIYEWSDAPYLGKVTSQEDDYLPVRQLLWPMISSNSVQSRKHTCAQLVLLPTASALAMNWDDSY
jgi:hypothetical protein